MYFALYSSNFIINGGRSFSNIFYLFSLSFHIYFIFFYHFFISWILFLNIFLAFFSANNSTIFILLGYSLPAWIYSFFEPQTKKLEFPPTLEKLYTLLHVGFTRNQWKFLANFLWKKNENFIFIFIQCISFWNKIIYKKLHRLGDFQKLLGK